MLDSGLGEDKVKDLIARRTVRDQEFMDHPDFPADETMRLYKVFDFRVDDNMSSFETETAISSTGELDAATTQAMLAGGFGNFTGAASSDGGPAPEPKPPRKPKGAGAGGAPAPQKPAAKAKSTLSKANAAVTEIKSWPAKLATAGVNAHLAAALVKDLDVHCESLTRARSDLEAKVFVQAAACLLVFSCFVLSCLVLSFFLYRLVFSRLVFCLVFDFLALSCFSFLVLCFLLFCLVFCLFVFLVVLSCFAQSLILLLLSCLVLSCYFLSGFLFNSA